MMELLEKNKELPRYLTMDYLFAIAYDESESIRKLINDIPPFDYDFIIGIHYNLESLCQGNETVLKQYPLLKLSRKK